MTKENGQSTLPPINQVTNMVKSAAEESEIQKEEVEGRRVPEGQSPYKKSGTETLSRLESPLRPEV